MLLGGLVGHVSARECESTRLSAGSRPASAGSRPAIKNVDIRLPGTGYRGASLIRKCTPPRTLP